MAIDYFWIANEDETDKVNMLPIDVSPAPELKKDVYLSGSPPSWEDLTVLPPVYTIADPGATDHGGTLFISGEKMTIADKNLLQAKAKAGALQKYYDAYNAITYLVYLYPAPKFKYLRGSTYIEYTITMVVA